MNKGGSYPNDIYPKNRGQAIKHKDISLRCRIIVNKVDRKKGNYIE